MATTSEKVRKLPVEEAPEAKDPQIVINTVEVTIALGPPLMFGVPLRVVNRILEHLGLVTSEELAEVIEPKAATPKSEPKVARPARPARPAAKSPRTVRKAA